MSNRGFFPPRFDAEYAAKLRVFRALLSARLDSRPHAKSRSAGELVQLLVYEDQTGIDLCEKGEVYWNEPKGFPTLEEMIAGYERYHHILGELLWVALFDIVHLRGQLSAYLLPMGERCVRSTGRPRMMREAEGWRERS